MLKRIKIVIGLLLLLTGFVFNGELFILYLDNFQESFYQASFSFENISQNVSDSEIINDFVESSIVNDVNFFFIDSDITSAYHKVITIYGNQNALTQIVNKGIDHKINRSFFLGTVEVVLLPFEKIENIRKFKVCYLTNSTIDIKQMKSFKSVLIDKYGGGFPKLYGDDKELWLNLSMVWMTIFFVIIILTLYEMICEKKEIAVRLIMGEDIRSIFFRNSIFDALWMTGQFIVLLFTVSSVSHADFKIKYILYLFGLFLLLNTLIHSSVFFINFKKNLSRSQNSKTILSISYTLKILVTLLTIFILSSNLVVISDGFNKLSQKKFFEEHKNYCYYRLNYIGNRSEDEEHVNLTFNQRFSEYSLKYVDLSDDLYGIYPVILVDKNALEEISSRYKELKIMSTSFENGQIYILKPSKLKNDSLEYENAELIVTLFFPNSKIIPLTYFDNISVVGINNRIVFKSNLLKDPIIIIDNSTPKTDTIVVNNSMHYMHDVMYDLTNEDFISFTEQFKLTDQIVVKSNVLEVYNHNLKISLRNIKIISILSVLVLILELSLIAMIIQIEYSLNSVEMSLKKVFGYNVLERNRKIVLTTIISILISTFGSFVFYSILGNAVSNRILVFWCSICIVFTEITYVIVKSISMDKKKIASILKGEKI